MNDKNISIIQILLGYIFGIMLSIDLDAMAGIIFGIILGISFVKINELFINNPPTNR